MPIKNEGEALQQAKQRSKDEQSLFTVVHCHNSDAYYIEPGEGGIIRNFEEIVAHFENGKKVTL